MQEQDRPTARLQYIPYRTVRTALAFLETMAKASSNEVLKALKNSLRDLERVRMTAPNDAELRELKREIRKMIERAKRAAAPPRRTSVT